MNMMCCRFCLCVSREATWGNAMVYRALELSATSQHMYYSCALVSWSKLFWFIFLCQRHTYPTSRPAVCGASRQILIVRGIYREFVYYLISDSILHGRSDRWEFGVVSDISGFTPIRQLLCTSHSFDSGKSPSIVACPQSTFTQLRDGPSQVGPVSTFPFWNRNPDTCFEHPLGHLLGLYRRCWWRHFHLIS